MRPIPKGFQYSLGLTEGASYVSCRFLTPEKFDPQAGVSTMIYDQKGIPVKTANEQDGSYDEELRLYPDNCVAYIVKWRSLDARLDNPDSVKSIVRSDMTTLLAKEYSNSAEWLYAIAVGYRRLAQHDQHMQALTKMARQWPDNPLTDLALEDYAGNLESADLSDAVSNRLLQQRWTLMCIHPRIAMIQPEAFRDLGLQKNLSIQQIELLCNFWIAKEHLNPFPLFHLAQAYYTRNLKPERALQLIDTAISLILHGMLSVYDDPKHSWEPLVIAPALRIKSHLCLRLGRFGDAYVNLQVAEMRSPVTDPQLVMLKAQLYSHLGMFERAQETYLKAIREGWEPARDSLLALYIRRKGNPVGFEKLFLSSDTVHETTPNLRTDASPAFSVMTLDGKRFDSDSLVGKVVVLNFWTTWCAPCVAELPSLNQLVQDFKSKDVVFLAIDPSNVEGELLEFLGKHSFLYNVVPNGSSVAEQFQVSVFPTHIVIDRKGRVAQKLVGGDTKRHLVLAPIIQKLLQD
jgi:thiol-disulfide isomerase/thioredoxin